MTIAFALVKTAWDGRRLTPEMEPGRQPRTNHPLPQGGSGEMFFPNCPIRMKAYL